MASLIFTLLTTTLRQAFAENTNLNALYCSTNAVTVLNAPKSSKIRSTMNFKNLKFTCISSASQPASLP